MKHCVVSFIDTTGIRHSVEVHAGSVYEAAAAALESFSQHECLPGLSTQLEVQVQSTVTHTIALGRLKGWAELGGGLPREVVLKKRIKVALNGSAPLVRTRVQRS